MAAALGGCAWVPRVAPVPPSTAWDDPEQTRLGQAVQGQLAAYPGLSAFHLLDSGMDALSMRAGLSEAAQRTLDLQYYALHEDVTTQLLLYRVLVAAHRGVRVRLLVDDMNTAGKDVHLATLSSEPNIEVRVFNPFASRSALRASRFIEFMADATRLTRRMHNKLWIADNAAAIVGGRNLGDAYFDAGMDFNFSDIDVLAVGPVVRDLSRSFDMYWNSPLAVPIESLVAVVPGAAAASDFERRLKERLQVFRDSDYARILRSGRLGPQLLAGTLPLVPAAAEALYDPPSKSAQGGPDQGSESATPLIFSPRLRSILQGARQELILISPYFVPSDEGIDFLGAAVRRGVRVRILTNSLASTDVPAVHAGYARVRPRLLAAGVELHEMRATELSNAQRSWRPGSSNASLHAKAILVDRRVVLLGSMNLDPRSRRLNTEVAVLIDSDVLGGRLGEIFDEAVRPAHAVRVERTTVQDAGGALTWLAEDDGRVVLLRSEPASAWRHLLANILGLLTPDDQL